jgi:hypothetical protein
MAKICKVTRRFRVERCSEHQRIVMWDNTDVPIFKPSAADAQRMTFSVYYAGNVAKGGVFIQPCGWMGTGDLWEGGVTDSEYMLKSGITKQQEAYLKTDNKDIPWTIILDRGCRVSVEVWQVGKQKVVQPCFSKSDMKFTDRETIQTAAVAYNRSANERAVHLAKCSDYISRGLLPNQSPRRLSDVWLAWGFHCNFIYCPVL